MVPNNVVPQGAYLIYRKTNWNEFIIISHIVPELSFEAALEVTNTLTKSGFYTVNISNQINLKVILTPSILAEDLINFLNIFWVLFIFIITYN